ncbi:MAG: anti-sigma factor family protein [Bacillota bacterium]
MQQHVSEKLPFYLNGTMEARERAAVHAHLSACASCREELAFWQRLSGLVAEEVRAAEQDARTGNAAPRFRPWRRSATGPSWQG